jgi:hypothetical protein
MFEFNDLGSHRFFCSWLVPKTSGIFGVVVLLIHVMPTPKPQAPPPHAPALAIAIWRHPSVLWRSVACPLISHELINVVINNPLP